MLTRLTYFSENHLNIQNGPVLTQLNSILASSIRNNEAAGITGVLVFDDFWFIQALEGERSKVLQTFDRLKCDERHSRIVLVEICDLEERTFSKWWMGLATRNKATLSAFAPYLCNGVLQPDRMPGRQLFEFVRDVAALQAAHSVLKAEA